jgi:hypothetical protein
MFKRTVKISNTLFYITLLPILVLAACYRTQIPNEEKYREHYSYAEYIDWIKSATDTLDSDFEKTTFIRKKTAELIDAGNGRRNVQTLDQNWPSWKASRYYNIFLTDSATVSCGGSAHFLRGVYTDLGYKATTYDMGCPGAVTHQLTLVWDKQVGDYIVQDAFFNACVTDHHNNPLAFSKLISLLSEKKSSEVKVLQSEYDYIPHWDSTGISNHRLSSSRDDSIYNYFAQKVQPAGAHQVNKLFYARAFEAVLFAEDYIYKNCLQEHKLPNDPLYLFLVPQEHNELRIKSLLKSAKAKNRTLDSLYHTHNSFHQKTGE